MQGSSRTLQKTAVFVEVSLADESVVLGKLFTTPQGRVIDTLNDDRDFLPFESMEGVISALAKAAIKQVTLPTASAPAYRGRDPYLVLDVPQGVSHEELKKAYHRLCFKNHPDRVKGLGLSSDFVEFATQNMMRINSAYVQVLKTMKIAGNGTFGDSQP